MTNKNYVFEKQEAANKILKAKDRLNEAKLDLSDLQVKITKGITTLSKTLDDILHQYEDICLDLEIDSKLGVERWNTITPTIECWICQGRKNFQWYFCKEPAHITLSEEEVQTSFANLNENRIKQYLNIIENPDYCIEQVVQAFNEKLEKRCQLINEKTDKINRILNLVKDTKAKVYQIKIIIEEKNMENKAKVEMRKVETKFGVLYIDELVDAMEYDRVYIYDSNCKYLSYILIERLDDISTMLNITIEEAYEDFERALITEKSFETLLKRLIGWNYSIYGSYETIKEYLLEEQPDLEDIIKTKEDLLANEEVNDIGGTLILLAD